MSHVLVCSFHSPVLRSGAVKQDEINAVAASKLRLINVSLAIGLRLSLSLSSSPHRSRSVSMDQHEYSEIHLLNAHVRRVRAYGELVGALRGLVSIAINS